MAKIVSDIRDFVTDMASAALPSASTGLTKRKIALITGITGQVIIIINDDNFIKICLLGWKLSDGIFT